MKTTKLILIITLLIGLIPRSYGNELAFTLSNDSQFQDIASEMIVIKDLENLQEKSCLLSQKFEEIDLIKDLDSETRSQVFVKAFQLYLVNYSSLTLAGESVCDECLNLYTQCITNPESSGALCWVIYTLCELLGLPNPNDDDGGGFGGGSSGGGGASVEW
ncbi:MAG: hypothetical protein HRU40_21630 [Saprospiraceae bacterium]|nr:hypothetical protein [Saprospiraceae bacterium]